MGEPKFLRATGVAARRKPPCDGRCENKKLLIHTYWNILNLVIIIVPTYETMSSRILLSVWACLFGGLVVFALMSVGILEPLSLGRASRFEEIVFLVIAGLPVIAWVVVFFRSP